MTPYGRMDVKLPGIRPRVRVRFGQRDFDVPVVPHRILISTIEMGVYIVWHAAWHPLQNLPLVPQRTGDSLAEVLKGADVYVDGGVRQVL